MVLGEERKKWKERRREMVGRRTGIQHLTEKGEGKW